MRTKTGRRARTLGRLIGLGLLLSVTGMANANSVTLAWNPNPEPDLSGYKLYFGTSSGVYEQLVDVGHVTTYTVSDLASGNTYYFALTAYDIYTNESAFSIEVTVAIPQESSPSVPLGDKEESTSGEEAVREEAGWSWWAPWRWWAQWRQ